MAEPLRRVYATEFYTMAIGHVSPLDPIRAAMRAHLAQRRPDIDMHTGMQDGQCSPGLKIKKSSIEIESHRSFFVRDQCPSMMKGYLPIQHTAPRVSPWLFPASKLCPHVCVVLGNSSQSVLDSYLVIFLKTIRVYAYNAWTVLCLRSHHENKR